MIIQMPFINGYDEIYRRDFMNQFYAMLREKLTKIEFSIIVDRYGLEDGKEKTLAEIGDKWNTTVKKISQIQSQAMNKIRLWAQLNDLQEDYLGTEL